MTYIPHSFRVTAVEKEFWKRSVWQLQNSTILWTTGKVYKNKYSKVHNH